MRKRNFLTALVLLGLATALVDRKYADIFGVNIPTKTLQGEINVPVYNIFTGLHPGNCSAYARKSAEELFGKNYSLSPAWGRRENDRLVAQINGQSLDFFVNQGILKSGMIIGTFNSSSPYNEKHEPYTHNMLYIGQNKQGQPLFADQFRTKTQVRTEKQIRDAGLIPMEIIDSRE